MCRATHPPLLPLPCCSLEGERDKALTEMNGHFLSNRPIRVSLATAKKNANTTTASAVQAPHPSGEPGRHTRLRPRAGHARRPQSWLRTRLPVLALCTACTCLTLTSCPPPTRRTDFDPTNTTLFIGGLSGGVTEDQLRAAFARFGDIIYVKIPAVRACREHAPACSLQHP